MAVRSKRLLISINKMPKITSTIRIMKKYPAIGIWLVLVVFGVANAFRMNANNTKLRSGIASLESATEEARLAKAESEINVAARKSELSELKVSLAEALVPAVETRGTFETELMAGLSTWTQRVDRLAKYSFDFHDIDSPPFYFVDDWDWFHVVQNRPLETEADFRLAMADLREAGRGKAIPEINRALHGYLKEHGWKMPPDIDAVRPYLKDNSLGMILDGFEVSQVEHPLGAERGLIPALVEIDSGDHLAGSRYVIWNGGVQEQYFHAPVDEMREAIDTYKAQFGRLPESVDDVSELIERGLVYENGQPMSSEQALDLFNASLRVIE